MQCHHAYALSVCPVHRRSVWYCWLLAEARGGRCGYRPRVCSCVCVHARVHVPACSFVIFRVSNTARQCQPHMPHIIAGRFHGGCLPCKHCLAPPVATSTAAACPRPYSFRARLPAPRRRALSLPPGRTTRAKAPIRPLHPAPTWYTLLDTRIQQHVATSAPTPVGHVLGVLPGTSSAGRLPRA